MSEMVETIVSDCRRDIKARKSKMFETGVEGCKIDAEHSELMRFARKYRKNLMRYASAQQSKRRSEIRSAEQAIMSSYATRLMAAVRGTAKSNPPLPFTTLETLAKEISLSDACNDPIYVSALLSKPGPWRPIAHSSRRRKCQLLMVRDIWLVAVGDAPFDSTVRGKGGESRVFEDIKDAMTEGYQYWVSLDVKNYFPSLKPGHLAGFPLPMWVKENVVFLPPNTPMIFSDWRCGLSLTEEALSADEDIDLPKGYPYSIGDLLAMLSTVRQGLPQGDVHTPLIARTFLGREIQRALKNRDIACGTHLDDILLGARSQSELKASIKALTRHLTNLPAGPLELHPHEPRHIKQGFEYLGYRLDFSGPGGSLHIRPTRKRFLRLKERLKARWAAEKSFDKSALREIGLAYARDWFRSQRCWTLIARSANTDPFQTYSWDYVQREVEIALNEFIYNEYDNKYGGWHTGDIDFALLEDDVTGAIC